MSNFGQYTIAELRTLIRNAHVVLDLPAATGTSKLRKAELVEAMVDLQARLDVKSARADIHTSIAGPDGLGQRTDDPMDTMIDHLPVIATDVSAAKVSMVVQLGKRLAWGTLISVVNRRTAFSPAFLCTVEVDGVRRLVAADHCLAA